MAVLDLGCGGGTFTLSAARAAGEGGRVYALDVQQAMLKQLERKLAQPEHRDIKNVELKLTSAYGLPFPDRSLDLVFVVTALQEMPDKKRALREIRRVLRPGGVLAVTEMLPDPDFSLAVDDHQAGSARGILGDGVRGNALNYTVRFTAP